MIQKIKIFFTNGTFIDYDSVASRKEVKILFHANFVEVIDSYGNSNIFAVNNIKQINVSRDY
jgi:UDP-N-acetylglucosamine transferase subunit ALG13